MPTPQQNNASFVRGEKYAAMVDRLYLEAIKEAAKLVSIAKFNPDKPFSFNDFPLAKKRIEKILNSLAKDMQVTILKAIEQEWNFSNAENDALVKSLFPKLDYQPYMNRNIDALKAFQRRKVSGMNLSERIWNMTLQFKQEMQLAIDVGLSEGRSADELSRDIRKYLKDPDKLFRRVRDSRGNLVLSKAARAYHPGQGKYRSSYKNAMRVTRTETNMAYRESDYQRRQKFDFIVGQEVHLSNNHPVDDICDNLKGRYPKDFKFTGWHPHCRCHCLSVLATREELNRIERAHLSGQQPDFKSVNNVPKVPEGFTSWINDNRERIKRYKSKPYFMQDNPQYVS